jgi:hypothetical protein
MYIGKNNKGEERKLEKDFIKVENWVGREVYVVRDTKKRIVTYLDKNKVKLPLEELKKYFKQNLSLDTNKRITYISDGTKIISFLYKSSESDINTPPKTKAPKYNASYEITGVYKGQIVSRRSYKLNSSSGGKKLLGSEEEAKKMAWNNFLGTIGQKKLQTEGEPESPYDKNEGLKALKRGEITQIREGWVYY